MYTFIVNPNSRSGLGRTIWKQIEATLRQKNIAYDVHFTKFQHHATRIVRELTADEQLHTIVALGGDGTINEVVNGIRFPELVTLGYIPTGSSNDFARGFGLPTDPLAALDVVLKQERIVPMDIGLLIYPDKQRRFAVSSGIGFDAAICHQAVVSPLKVLLNKLKLGKLTYAAIAINRLMLDSPSAMTLVLDDHQTLQFDSAYFVSVCNHRFEGGGLMMCPEADPADGYLDVIVISNISKLKILFLLPTAFSGRHTKIKGVHIYRCKTAAIESKKSLPVHADGEPIFLQHRVEMSLYPSKLKVILGK